MSINNTSDMLFVFSIILFVAKLLEILQALIVSAAQKDTVGGSDKPFDWRR